MKNLSNLCFVILLVGLAVSINGCSNHPVKYKEIEATKLLSNLQESFIVKNQKKYPRYFAGAYLENNRLIVIVIGDTCHVKEDIMERCRGNNITMFQCKEKSDATRKILHELHRFKGEKKNVKLVNELQFKACYLNSDQRISIELLSFQENLFREKVIDSPLFDFEDTIIELE